MFISDLISEAQQVELAKHLQCRALASLEQHSKFQGSRLYSLLLILPVLNSPSVEQLDAVLFKPVIGHVSMDTVISTI